MKDYFLLPDLQYDSYRDTLKEYALNCKDWPSYGIGRFKIYIARPTRELIIPIAIKFKNPKTLFHKIEFNKVAAWGIVHAHTDHDRFATINLPIAGDFENSSVDFYKTVSEGALADYTPDIGDKDIVFTAKTYRDAELTEVVKYQQPICFNTQVVHGVTNYSAVDRYILTLSFKEEFTYEKLHTMYTEGELLV
jgi:hypothetical protein|tara:strand:- start:81 stop:659 length:579 start_codon:yes stop_codon:yes gene_type:complete